MRTLSRYSIATVITLTCLFKTGYGQNPTGALVSQRGNEVMGPSPTVNNIGSFAADGVKNFTGTSLIEIPLYEIKLKNFSLPIKLKYDNSGLKVAQTSSWVGAGWSLQAGGLITREVRGLPDDVIKQNIPYNISYGYLVGGSAALNEFTDTGVSDAQIEQQLATLNGTLIKTGPNTWGYPDSPNGQYGKYADVQPDMFYYNFGDQNGKFLFGADQKIKLVNYQPYQIDYILDNTTSPNWSLATKGVTSFAIVDENGNTYKFSELDYTEVTGEGDRIRTYCDVNAPVDFDSYSAFTSSWYLTEIVTAYGEKVSFRYEDEVIYSNSYTFTGVGDDAAIPRTYGYGHTRSRSRSRSKRLSGIETPNETINFIASGLRDDVGGAHYLSDLQVISKFGSKNIKQVNFTYSYFQSSLSEPAQTSPDNTMGDFRKRLKLESLRIFVNPDPVNPQRYSFYYNEQSPLPNRYSFQQDFWGYYNGNNATHMLPTIYVHSDLTGADRFSVLQLAPTGSSGNYVLGGGINRNSNAATIALGTLRTIVYPTGGSSTYEYELHDFIYRGLPFSGGGLRVKKVTDYDGISHANDIVKTYNYHRSDDAAKSSGKLFNLPVFAYLENNCAFSTSVNPPPNYPRGGFDYFNYNTVKQSNPMTISGLGDNVTVGYSEIKEIIQGNGYVLSKFSTPVTSGNLDDISAVSCDLGENGYCDALYSKPPAIRSVVSGVTYLGALLRPDIGPDLSGLDFSSNSYPYIQNMNYDWNRGLLLNKKIYDNANTLKTQVEYKYKLITPETGVYYVNGLHYSNSFNYKIGRSGFGVSPIWTNLLVLYGRYTLISNINKALETETKTDYLANGAETTSTAYTYSKGKFINSLALTNSKGQVSKVLYRYPFDYSVNPGSVMGPTNPISYLVFQNRISTPIETINSIIRNGEEVVISSRINGFTNVSSNVVPAYENFLALNAPIPESDYQKAHIEWEGPSEIFYQDPRVYGGIIFSRYDEAANLLETNKWNTYNAFIWGYNKKYPVASIRNARSTDVFYEGFEELTGTGASFMDDAKTGHYSKTNGYSKTLQGLNSGLYNLSYWKKTNGKWELVLVNNINVTGNTYTINISSALQVDDIRFNPVGALMTTNTYDPLIGITSSTDAKGVTTFYDYDEYNRLRFIKDQNGNIITHNEYHYKP